jgi:hypothetical protein
VAGGLTGTHVDGDAGWIEDENLRDDAINQAAAKIAALELGAVLLTGAQTVNGVKNFTSAPTVNGAPIGTGTGGAPFDASALTTGTLDDARLPSTAQASTLDTRFTGKQGTAAALVRNGVTMNDSLVVAHGAAAPAGTPVGTIIVELA